jgi:hypothetical protein
MSIDQKVHFVRHFVAALAYRGTNVLDGMPPHIADRRPGEPVRTPTEILNHVNGVLSFALSHVTASDLVRPPLADWHTEEERFFDILRKLDTALADADPNSKIEAERLLQGPLADAMLHLGQIGIFRRLGGAPVAPENYFEAPIRVGQLAYRKHG